MRNLQLMDTRTLIDVFPFLFFKPLAKSSKHSSDAPWSPISKEGVLEQGQVVWAEDSGLKDAYIILCYKATITREWETRISTEKPWESVGTPTLSSLHLRQCEEENWKGISQTEVDSDGVRACPGHVYFARFISFPAKWRQWYLKIRSPSITIKYRYLTGRDHCFLSVTFIQCLILLGP